MEKRRNLFVKKLWNMQKENNNIDESKKELRLEIRNLKKNFTAEQRTHQSKELVEKIEMHPEFVKSKLIMAYWAMKDEVDLTELIIKWHPEKQFLLPCVKGDELEIRRFEGLESLKSGEAFGILEPVGNLFAEYQTIDLILVPGVAFDNQNNRMGRGKAYYDKFLPKTKAFKMGICFDFQKVSYIPVTEFDIKMDEVLSFS